MTFVLPEDLPGTLSRMVQELGDPILRAAKIYSALDGQLVIDSFEIGARGIRAETAGHKPEELLRKAAQAESNTAKSKKKKK